MGAPLTGPDLSGRPPAVAFLVRSFGFPEGMAATNRLRLLCRALLEQGAHVEVLCTKVSESPGAVLNSRARGTTEGVPFLYTPGSTVRSDSFMVRRYREARGIVVAMLELKRLRDVDRLDCVYLPDVSKQGPAQVEPGKRLTVREMLEQLPTLWPLRAMLRALGVPVIIELNELPAAVTWLPHSLSRHISHLSLANAVTPISDYLTDWTAHECARIGRRLDVMEIPVIVDVVERPYGTHPPHSEMFVYSVSGYRTLVATVFRAMRLVWERHPGCRLILTGIRPDVAAGVAAAAGVEGALHDGRIALTGYLDRPALLDLCGRASALLVPLHDDLESRARFPTKLGEYLAAARPVVTTAVGEIPRFLTDGETAYLADGEAPEQFAARLIDVLDDPDKAERIALAGRALAERLFDYRLQGPRLADLIERVSRRRPGEGRD